MSRSRFTDSGMIWMRNLRRVKALRIYKIPYLIVMILLLSQISVIAGGMGKWWKNQEIVNKLQLSSQQVDSIEKIFNQHKDKLHETKKELLIKEKELNQKLNNSEANRDEISKLAEELDTLKLELRKNYRSMQLEIREVLNPEQREILQSLWSSRKHKK